MTPEELDEIKRREREASPGPWDKEQSGNVWEVLDAVEELVCEAEEGVFENVRANMKFIASARTDIPRLVSALEEAWREIERLKNERSKA